MNFSHFHVTGNGLYVFSYYIFSLASVRYDPYSDFLTIFCFCAKEFSGTIQEDMNLKLALKIRKGLNFFRFKLAKIAFTQKDEDL